MLGGVPEAVFKTLMAKYEVEREERTQLVQTLSAKISDSQMAQQDIDSYIDAIKKYVAVERLDREMLLELVKGIDIGEVREENGRKTQEIIIHYNYLE